jgi:hypothetical protein
MAYNGFQERKSHHNSMMEGLDSHPVMMVMVVGEAAEVEATGLVDSSFLAFSLFWAS